MTKIDCVAIAILVLSQLPGTVVAQTKGNLRKTTSTPVYQNAEGKLFSGSSGNSSPLTVEVKEEGTLLSVQINGKRCYLAYPLEKDSADAPVLVDEPGPGCYWRSQRVSAGMTRYLAILEKEYFDVPQGPFKGSQLSCDDKKLVVLQRQKPARPNVMPLRPPHIGRTFEYDNLDDGK